MDTKELLPFHLFQYNGERYMINVEKMQADTMDQYSYSYLEKLAIDGYMVELPPDMQSKLEHYGLLPTEGTKSRQVLSPKHTPITYMSLLVTQDCNLRCIYCYEDKTKARMDEKTAFRAVDWLIRKSEDMRSIHIVFFGGEPLLNFPLMKAVVEYANEAAHKAGKQATYSITTNGTLLDDEKNQFFLKHQIKVMISIDGLKELQDVQRPFASGSGSYDLILPKIHELLKLIPQTSGHAVVMGNTSPEKVKDALQELGFQQVSVAMNSQSLFTLDSQKDKASDRDIRSMISALEEEAIVWYNRIIARDTVSINKLTGRSYLYLALRCLLNHSIRIFFCGAGRSMAAVAPSGDIYLCHRFVGLDDYRIGSIDEYDLNLESFSQSPVETNAICNRCFARYYCGGGCKHDHVSSCGYIDQPEEGMCQLKQRELELAATVVSRLSYEDRNWLVKEKIFPPKPCPLDF
jgi:uncharacterized protein